eukprot:jgi/Orpsp1_1/1183105/evm.model.c7180000083883.1
MKNSKTLACRQFEFCITEIKKTKKVSAEIIDIFKQSIMNPHDDPGYYSLLSEIAKNAGIEEEQIFEMWDYY